MKSAILEVYCHDDDAVTIIQQIMDLKDPNIKEAFLMEEAPKIMVIVAGKRQKDTDRTVGAIERMRGVQHITKKRITWKMTDKKSVP